MPSSGKTSVSARFGSKKKTHKKNLLLVYSAYDISSLPLVWAKTILSFQGLFSFERKYISLHLTKSQNLLNPLFTSEFLRAAGATTINQAHRPFDQ